MDKTSQQTTSNILMVRPANFGFNPQTAESNSFQIDDNSLSVDAIKQKAIKEFDDFVERLRKKGINIHVAQDTATPVKPDAVFPNNWVTFHDNGSIITYPMNAPLRRPERRAAIIDDLRPFYKITKERHLEFFESQNKYLEGTGSMILDRVNRVVYACISPRTEASLLEEFCLWADYTKVQFHSTDSNNQDIYHTNVMMALGVDFVVICMESIKNEEERTQLLESFAKTSKKVIEISFDQVLSFAGNMLQVCNKNGDTFLVMSEQAYQSLSKKQVQEISEHTNILYSPINTIETYGGGSARCMMAEIFLPEIIGGV